MKSRNIHLTKRSLTASLILFILIFFGACNNSNNIDCDPGIDCDQIEPTTGLINLNLAQNDENPTVPIAIYYGNADDSSLFFRDTIFSGERTSYSVPIRQRYSVVAKFLLEGRRIYAVDGGKVRLKTKDNCGYTCYESKDLDLDLKVIR